MDYIPVYRIAVNVPRNDAFAMVTAPHGCTRLKN